MLKLYNSQSVPGLAKPSNCNLNKAWRVLCMLGMHSM